MPYYPPRSTTTGTGANYGVSTLDFGSSVGTGYITLAVTGQTNITTTSNVNFWIQSTDSTATHSTYEHMILSKEFSFSATNIISGTGFTINALTDLRLTGTLKVRWSWA